MGSYALSCYRALPVRNKPIGQVRSDGRTRDVGVSAAAGNPCGVLRMLSTLAAPTDPHIRDISLK